VRAERADAAGSLANPQSGMRESGEGLRNPGVFGMSP
jgi:hypothetical protein